MIIYSNKVDSVRARIMNISRAEGIDFDTLLLREEIKLKNY